MTWPVEPLLALPGVTEHRIQRALHISGTTWQQLRHRGLDDWQADRAAIRLGYHPAVVWPEWIEAALTPLDQQWLHEGWRTAWLWREAA